MNCKKHLAVKNILFQATPRPKWKVRKGSSQVADLKLRTSEIIAIAELRLRSNIPLKVAELRLRKLFLQVAELRLWTPKKVARAHLWYQ